MAEASGWAFEFNNEYYPDVDDTLKVLLALRLIQTTDEAAKPEGKAPRAKRAAATEAAVPAVVVATAPDEAAAVPDAEPAASFADVAGFEPGPAPAPEPEPELETSGEPVAETDADVSEPVAAVEPDGSETAGSPGDDAEAPPADTAAPAEDETAAPAEGEPTAEAAAEA